jgi:hypothetical protein
MDAKKKSGKLVLPQHSPNYCQHEPFTFVPATQDKHGDGNGKTNRQLTDRMKTRGNKEELGNLQPS